MGKVFIVVAVILFLVFIGATVIYPVVYSMLFPVTHIDVACYTVTGGEKFLVKRVALAAEEQSLAYEVAAKYEKLGQTCTVTPVTAMSPAP